MLFAPHPFVFANPALNGLSPPTRTTLATCIPNPEMIQPVSRIKFSQSEKTSLVFGAQNTQTISPGEGLRPLPPIKEVFWVQYQTANLMMKLQFWRSGEYPLCLPVLLDLFSLEVGVHVWISSMGQIDFEISSIGLCVINK